MQDMINNSKWLNGPIFLRKNEESWPSDLTNVQNELSDDDSEVKLDVQSHSQTLAHRPNVDFLSSLIQRHSSLEKLKRTVAWLLRFKSLFVTRYSQRSKRNCQTCARNFVPRGPSSFAEDQFLKMLPSSNCGAKEVEDAGLHA